MNHPARPSHRPASPADLASVVEFPQNAQELFFSYPRASWPLSVAQLATAMAERSNSTVALLDGRVAGFANFYQAQPNEFCALGNLMIAPWARGQGVAHYLIGEMERQALEDFNAACMRASCHNDNAAGLLLYARLGYRARDIVERQDFAGRRVALVQMEKSLG
ncbi:GNAT family N-acetyltransferase [Pseudomonas sp. LPB0260]|uniref:GNAT family N-acetyltransferase n=1 Tax=Pseudomonas sp. LPB0260 TaxID=2614442 RepID=UPI0015C252E2|nr:GNAT family N-acetyltransferase [Pseudomonas sp. LPB0260]QLC73648.1 GNAT family N-acetyltransferase [Pseudomonas sp. LPB0260]QLC76422.1 GNAT family N-acetyltransferase [Pseudomonas sp. LPB0260]